MSAANVHIIGAGLAGLAAAVKLAEAGRNKVILHEAAPQAGGRCRSYFEPALGLTIDNGNHLVLSGNGHVHDYIGLIGSGAELIGPERPEFDFRDFRSGQAWRLRPNMGPVAWWIFSKARRVPDTRARDYLPLAWLMQAGAQTTVAEVLSCQGTLYERLWQPFLLAALNMDPPQASARLAGNVVRQSLAKGGKACRPLSARNGLSVALVEPALAFINARGGEARFGARLRSMSFSGAQASVLHFDNEEIQLAASDEVIVATPPWVVAQIMPEQSLPQLHSAIVNGHFAYRAKGSSRIIGLIGSLSEWLFVYPEYVSVTISGAGHCLDWQREKLAQTIWADIQRALNISDPMPKWQIVKEKRATFLATPEQDQLRPGAETKWQNVTLAGDYTQTGLPSTIEGALTSGFRAAERLKARAALPKKKSAR